MATIGSNPASSKPTTQPRGQAPAARGASPSTSKGSQQSHGPGPAGTYQGYVDPSTGRWVQPSPPPGTRSEDIIAVLGDSISDQGRGLTSSTWASQLAAMLGGKTLWVAGRGGQPATTPLNKRPAPPGGDIDSLLTLLLARKPGTLILQLGLNDFHNGKTAAEFKSAMMKIIARIRKESPNTKIVLMGVKDTFAAPSKSNKAAYAAYLIRVEEFQKAFDEIGSDVQQHGGIYVPDTFAGLKNKDGQLSTGYRRGVKGDPIHPNEAGAKVIASSVKKALVENGVAAENDPPRRKLVPLELNDVPPGVELSAVGDNGQKLKVERTKDGKVNIEANGSSTVVITGSVNGKKFKIRLFGLGTDSVVVKSNFGLTPIATQDKNKALKDYPVDEMQLWQGNDPATGLGKIALRMPKVLQVNMMPLEINDVPPGVVPKAFDANGNELGVRKDEKVAGRWLIDTKGSTSIKITAQVNGKAMQIDVKGIGTSDANASMTLDGQPILTRYKDLKTKPTPDLQFWSGSDTKTKRPKIALRLPIDVQPASTVSAASASTAGNLMPLEINDVPPGVVPKAFDANGNELTVSKGNIPGQWLIDTKGSTSVKITAQVKGKAMQIDVKGIGTSDTDASMTLDGQPIQTRYKDLKTKPTPDLQFWSGSDTKTKRPKIALRLPIDVQPASTVSAASASTAGNLMPLEINDVPPGVVLKASDANGNELAVSQGKTPGQWLIDTKGSTSVKITAKVNGKDMQIDVKGIGTSDTDASMTLDGQPILTRNKNLVAKPISDLQFWSGPDPETKRPKIALRLPIDVQPASTVSAASASTAGNLMPLEINDVPPGVVLKASDANGNELTVSQGKTPGQWLIDTKGSTSVKITAKVNGKDMQIDITDIGDKAGTFVLMKLDGGPIPTRYSRLGGKLKGQPTENLQFWEGKDPETKKPKIALRLPTYVQTGAAGPASYKDSYKMPVPPSVPASSLVAVLGDSLSDGAFYQSRIGTPGAGVVWSSQLAQAGAPLWVSGVHGKSATGKQTASDGPTIPGATAAERLEKLLEKKPGTLVIELGANDFRAGASAAEFEKAMIAFIDRAQKLSPGTRIVVLGLRIPPDYAGRTAKDRADFAKAFQNIGNYLLSFNAARKTQGLAAHVYVPNIFEGITDNTGKILPQYRLPRDPIHPNQAGHAVIAALVKKALGNIGMGVDGNPDTAPRPDPDRQPVVIDPKLLSAGEARTLYDSGMTDAVARYIVDKFGGNSVAVNGYPTGTEGQWKNALLLIARIKLGLTTAAERAKLGGSPVVKLATKWINQAGLVAKALDTGTGMDAIAAKNPGLAKQLKGLPAGLGRAWVLYADAPQLVATVLKAGQADAVVEADLAVLASAGMSESVAQSILKIYNAENTELDLSEAAYGAESGRRTTLLLIARHTLGLLTSKEKAQLHSGGFMGLAKSYINKVALLTAKFQLGNGQATVAANDADFAAKLSGMATDADKAWTLFVQAPQLIAPVLASSTTIAELAPELSGAGMTDDQAKAILARFTGPFDINATGPQVIWANSLLLMAKIQLRQIAPSSLTATALTNSPVYKNALKLKGDVMTLSHDLTLRGVAYTGLYNHLTEGSAEWTNYNNILNQPGGGQVAAWRLLFNTPTLFETLLAVSGKATVDPKIMEIVTPVFYRGKPATIGSLISLIKSAPPTTPNHETLVKFLGALGEYIEGKKLKPGEDFTLTMTEIAKAAAAGVPGAAVLKGMGSLIGNDPILLSNVLHTIFEKIQPGLISTTPVSEPALPNSLDSQINALFEDWTKKYGTTEALKPLEAMQWLRANWDKFAKARKTSINFVGRKNYAVLPTAREATFAELEQFLRDQAPTNANAKYLLGNIGFTKLLLTNNTVGGITICDTAQCDALLEEMLKSATTAMGGKPVAGVPPIHDDKLTGILSVRAWAKFIGPLHFDRSYEHPRFENVRLSSIKMVRDSNVITTAQIRQFLEENPALPQGMRNTLLAMIGDAAYSAQVRDSVDMGFIGNVRSSGSDGRFAVADIEQFADQVIEAANKTKKENPVSSEPPTLSDSLSEARVAGWRAIAENPTVSVDKAREEALFNQAVTGGAIPATGPDAVHFARAVYRNQTLMAVLIAGKAKVFLGMELIYKTMDGRLTQDVIKEKLELITKNSNYEAFMEATFAPVMKQVVSADPLLKKQITDHALSLASSKSLAELASQLRSKDGTADWVKIKMVVGEQLASVTNVLSTDERLAIYDTFYKNLKNTMAPDVQKMTLDRLNELVASGNAKAILAWLDASLKTLGFDVKDLDKVPATQIAILAQRVIRLISTGMRAGNTRADALDGEVKSLLKTLDQTVDWTPNGNGQLAVAGTSTNPSQEYSPLTSQQKADLNAAYEKRTGKSINVNSQKDLLTAWRTVYGTESGSSRSSKWFYQFKQGAVHVLSFIAGMGLTVWAAAVAPPKSIGDKMKFASGFIVAGSGGFVGGIKYDFNKQLAAFEKEGISVSKYLDYEIKLKTEGKFIPIGTKLDLKESTFRMISGLAYMVYAGGSIYNLVNGGISNKPFVITDLIVNGLAGALPFVEGTAQFAKWRVAVVASRTEAAKTAAEALALAAAGTPDEAAAAESLAIARNANYGIKQTWSTTSKWAKLYGVGKTFFTWGGLAFAAAQAAVAIAGLVLTVIAADKKEKNDSKKEKLVTQWKKKVEELSGSMYALDEYTAPRFYLADPTLKYLSFEEAQKEYRNWRDMTSPRYRDAARYNKYEPKYG